MSHGRTYFLPLHINWRRSLLAFLLLGQISAAYGCDLTLLRQRLDRAMEPLDHAYNFEDRDDSEFTAELQRHAARLQALVNEPPQACNEHSSGAALLSYARRMLMHTLDKNTVHLR